MLFADSTVRRLRKTEKKLTMSLYPYGIMFPMQCTGTFYICTLSFIYFLKEVEEDKNVRDQ